MSRISRRRLLRSALLPHLWLQNADAPVEIQTHAASEGNPTPAKIPTPTTLEPPQVPETTSEPAQAPQITLKTCSAPPKAKPAWRAKPREWRAVALVIVLLLPSFLVPYELTNAFIMYTQMQDGMTHLQAAATIFQNKTGSGIARYFDAEKLQQTQAEIDAAHADFASLSVRLDQDNALSLASAFWPTQIETIRSLSRLAADGTAAAQQVLKTMSEIGPSLSLAFQNSASDTSLTPFLTPASYREVNTTLAAITPLIHQMTLTAQGLSLDSLPLNSKEQKLLASVLPLLPSLDAFLAQRSALQGPLGWLLGIDQQRTFLVEPMDSAELRATGGFTGQFGELVLNGAHLGPLKLSNIGIYEEDHSDEGSPPDPTVFPKVQGQLAPAPYSDWWPIPNFGMRDANLSADFPTSANIVMDRYTYEFGRTVDGVIMFTPTLIQEVLHVTGPISIPAYQQTITEQNLVYLLHYYQLDNAGIYQEQVVEHVADPQQARKLFTQRVTTALISAVTHLPLDSMLSLAGEMFQSMKTKDLQIYVTNPQLESLIGKYGSTAAMDRSTGHDTIFIVQSNLSANKASQYVTTSIQDTIQVDEWGGATHNLQLTLNYQQTGNVYGLDTYRDYVRVYVPVDSQFISGNGFDQYDTPYCGDGGSRYPICQANVYGDGSLICATPIEIGPAASYFGDPYENTDHPLDRIGPPQNQQSDEEGFAMFGGWVVIPKNCDITVTLSWYVPPRGASQYSLLFQGQASVYAPLDLTIEPAPGTCGFQQANALDISQMMNGENRLFTLTQQGTQCALVSSYS
jgi:hypothetical protein